MSASKNYALIVPIQLRSITLPELTVVLQLQENHVY